MDKIDELRVIIHKEKEEEICIKIIGELEYVDFFPLKEINIKLSMTEQEPRIMIELEGVLMGIKSWINKQIKKRGLLNTDTDFAP